GLYYVDTTISLNTQQTEQFHKFSGVSDVNVFVKNQTYYMYFLYAKKETQQTYQIYVGKSFSPTTMLKAVRGNLATAPIIFSDYKADTGKVVRLPAWLKPGTVDANGVMTVTIDFKGLTELDPTPANMCKPSTFCKPDGANCVTSLTADSPAVKANPGLLAQ